MSRLRRNIIFQLSFGKSKLFFAGLCVYVFVFVHMTFILIEVDKSRDISWLSLGRENKDYRCSLFAP